MCMDIGRWEERMRERQREHKHKRKFVHKQILIVMYANSPSLVILKGFNFFKAINIQFPKWKGSVKMLARASMELVPVLQSSGEYYFALFA